MKKINKVTFLLGSSILSIGLIAGVSTSCANHFAVINPSNIIQLNYNAKNTLLQSYTAEDWANQFSVHQYDNFINALNSINDSYLNSGFKIASSTASSVEVLNNAADNVLYINAIFKFQNSNQTLIINIDNLYIVPPTNITPPDLSIVSNPISIDQINLPVIYNTNPVNVLPSQWTYYINQISPENSLYIPNDLYYLKYRELAGDKIYKLTYAINEQYSVMLDINNYPDIIFNINISPNIDKIPNEKYILDLNDVEKYFPGYQIDNFDELPQIDIYQKLSEYVDNLGIYEPLVDCIDANDNTKVYNFVIIKSELINQISIQFTSNPNNSNSKIYFYSFKLKFK